MYRVSAFKGLGLSKGVEPMLSEEQIKQYRDDGYVLVSGIFAGEELNRLEGAFDHLIRLRIEKRASLDVTWSGEWKDKYPEQTQVHFAEDMQAQSTEFSRLLLHDGFTDAVADLIGPNVQLHHTKILQKPAGGGAGFPMHQDYPYFPHEKHTMMAGIIHLSVADEQAGCVRVYPGSHKQGHLPEFNTEAHYLDPEQYPIERGLACEARRGDVLFFSYLTVHGSTPNRSDNLRKTILIQMRDPTDRPVGDMHRSHAQGLMLRGMDPMEHGPEGNVNYKAVSV